MLERVGDEWDVTCDEKAPTIVRLCKIRELKQGRDELLTTTDIISSNWNQNLTAIFTKCVSGEEES